jgi:ubiquitin-small subunit ribosomal protein S27Ae
MQIFLHLLDGSQTVAQISQETTLESLLATLNASNCRVVYQGICLNSLDSLSENANLYLTGDLDGGKKKKKKKVYTTKKKNKHIHKRVKLGIYTLYSVDGTSNLT